MHCVQATAKVTASLGSWMAADSAAPGGGILGALAPLLIVFMIFYFLVIRPGIREKKDREAKVASIKKHTKVITNAGIHGTVVSSDNDSVTLLVDEKRGVRMRFTKGAIWQVLDGSESKTSGKSAPTSGSTEGATS